ncbi:MAG: DUF3460 family protein [Rhodocyclaceae bacterium]
MYESEHTKFIREFLRAHPEELEVRAQGRALWWDRPQDAETQRALRESRVPQKPYYYQPD